MGRNRKFVLEDDLQQAVWRTILCGPRPPDQRSGASPRSPVSASTARQWEETRGEGEGARSDFDTTPSFPLSRGNDGCCAQSSGEVEDSARHFGRRRRDIDHNQGSAPEGRGSSSRTPCGRTDSEHTVVHCPKGETRRAGTASGGPGSGCVQQSSCNPARAGGVVGRWGEG